MLKSLLDNLKRLGIDLQIEEIAEVLWLSTYLPGREPVGLNVDVAQEKEFSPPITTSHKFMEQIKEALASKISTPSPIEVELENPTAPLYVSLPLIEEEPTDSINPIGLGSASGFDAFQFRAPKTAALPAHLRIERSLKPLKRRVASRRHKVLDVRATIDNSIDYKSVLPVLRPAPERWLNITLVIDSASTMLLWDDVARELYHLFQRHPAFGKVDIWSLQSEALNNKIFLQKGVGKKARLSPHRSVAELVRLETRQPIWVLTDCVSEGWYNGTVPNLLQMWAKHQPVTLIQVLPNRLWRHTALGTAVKTNLSPQSSLTLNRRMLAKSKNWLGAETKTSETDKSFKLPVIGLDPHQISAWTSFTLGNRTSRLEGYMFELVKNSVDTKNLIEFPVNSHTTEPIQTPQQRLEAFRAIASPLAYQLAQLLALAPVTLPIARIVQSQLLPKSEFSDLAEVLLGGLLYEVLSKDTYKPDYEPRYDFYPQVREILQSNIPRDTGYSVLTTVTQYIYRHSTQTRTFAALLLDITMPGSYLPDADHREFARIGANYLRQLGGKFTSYAERLDQYANQPRPQELPVYPDLSDLIATALPVQPEVATPDELQISTPPSPVEETDRIGTAALNTSIQQASAYYKRGLECLELAEYAQAKTEFVNALELRPVYPQAYFALGNVYLQQKQYQEAIIRYNNALVDDANLVEVYYNRGQAYVAINEYDRAVEDFTNSLTFDYANPNYYLSRADAYGRLRNYSHAIADYEKALDLGAASVEVYMAMAKAQYSLRDYRWAIKYYDLALEKQPANIEAQLWRAYSCVGLEQFDEAVDSLQTLLDLKPDLYEALLTLGVVFCKKRRYSDAAQCLDEYLNQPFAPNKGQAAYYLAECYRHLEIRNKALFYYDMALREIPNYELVWFGRGLVKYDIQNYQAAIIDFTKAMELGSNDYTIRYYRARCNRKLNRMQEALDDYNMTLAIAPGFAPAHVERGLLHYELKKYDQALICFNIGVRECPGNSELYNGRGMTFYQQNRYLDALKDFQMAVKLGPVSSTFYRNLAMAYAKCNEYKLAIKSFSDAYHIANEITEKARILNERGRSFAAVGDYIAARHDFGKACDFMPDFAEAWANHAYTCLHLGNTTIAISSFNKAIMLQYNLLEAYLGRGRTYAEMGRYDEALADYNRVIDINPANGEAYYYRGMLFAKYGRKSRPDFERAQQLGFKFPFKS